MENSQCDRYYKGYIAGYRAGVRDVVSSKTIETMEKNIVNLPIEAMELSTRAYNCLSRAGCVRIADVVALSEREIAIMRSLGSKTASEIAQRLIGFGIYDSYWSNYI